MSRNRRTDGASRRVLEVLDEHYRPSHPDARIEAYRYNSASIRLRVVEPRFADTPLGQRDREVWKVLRTHLPDDTLSQISLLLLLAPEEQPASLMNREFEDPTPSRL